MAAYIDPQDDISPDMAPGVMVDPAAPAPEVEASAAMKAKVLGVIKSIKEDKKFHAKAFKQMRVDMFVARNGYLPLDDPKRYSANLTGRHVKQKTAALYAKNPKATARRRETMDFMVWDENPASLQLAMQTIQQATQLLAQQPVDPATGGPIVDPDPAMVEAFTKAQQVVADFQQGMQRRTSIQKVGKTLEILYSQAMREQKPIDFKTGMKKLVRRACTTSVGYVELAFQREYGPRPAMTEKLADATARLEHLRVLSEKMADTENPILPDDQEVAELNLAVAAMQAEPEVIVREGLIVDFPASTKVIPDKLCRSLVGFVGSRHLTLEYMYTCDEVREMFNVDLGKNFTGYKLDGTSGEAEAASENIIKEDGEESPAAAAKGEGLVCVWKQYDKPSGLVYYVADGYDQFLREPAAPDVFVEDFWPVYALTFNDVESEDSLFPPSDVWLMTNQQDEYNMSRQGMREHRKAARPRWTYANGAIEAEDAKSLVHAAPFTATALNLGPTQKLSDILDVIPVPGVDPNLYETGQLFTDIQLVVGSSEAQFGGTAKATATESAIAANSSASNDGSSIDDLDAFLTVVARASGQILLREMSEEQVKIICGPGAEWPHMTLADIANELYLEVEAGSTGKPNQAVEMANWEKMLPFLIQMPGLSPNWLARETVRRLDDNADLTEALAEGLPSIMAQNGMTQLSTGDPATDPNAQGGQGGQNAPTETSKAGGSGPAMGSNQV